MILEVPFLKTFSTSFWKIVRKSKEIVNIHGLFALTVCYGDINTYLPKKYYYIIERVYFIYRLFVLFISTWSSLLLLYKASWRYNRDYLHVSTDILLHSMFYIINIMEKQTLLYHVRSYVTKTVPIWTSSPQSTSYAPVPS